MPEVFYRLSALRARSFLRPVIPDLTVGAITCRRFAPLPSKYKNDMPGTIEIIAKEDALAVRMGKLNTVATPNTQPDTIRVVMQPGRDGEVIGFGKDADRSDRELRGSHIHTVAQ